MTDLGWLGLCGHIHIIARDPRDWRSSRAQARARLRHGRLSKASGKESRSVCSMIDHRLFSALEASKGRYITLSLRRM